MIHIPTKQRYDLIRPAVKLEKHGRRQFKTVCTAQRRPSHQHRESTRSFEKHVIAHCLILNHSTVTCSCNNKHLINSSPHCLRMASPGSQSVFMFFEDVNADSLQASSLFCSRCQLVSIFFFLLLLSKPFPIGDRVTFSGKDCMCQQCSHTLVKSNEPIKIHGPSRKFGACLTLCPFALRPPGECAKGHLSVALK